jgi:hypothetical protein
VNLYQFISDPQEKKFHPQRASLLGISILLSILFEVEPIYFQMSVVHAACLSCES